MGEVLSSWNGDGVFVGGESLTHHTNQMISNQEMALASATTDVLRARGISAMAEFMQSNAKDIASIHAALLQDKTNFSAFGNEQRTQMLLEYATGLAFFSKLSDEEKQGIETVAVRQYQQNQQTMVSWLLGGFVCIALVVALIAGNSGSKEQNNRSQVISAATSEMIA